ncbi:hypothetical protein ACSSAF_06565 [Staphylococcus succinus]|uniref:hypothetical protein n=1 Tax=Staphylococcus succinus TaxID=61015 RepID=UPI003F5C7742
MNMNEWINEDATQRDQYKTERDTLIDDLKVLREKNEKLERENDDQEGLILQFIHDLQYAEWEIVPHLKQENKALRLQANTYFDEWQNVKSQYTTLTDHIRLKASANPGEHRYIALVNFIDRLEKGEN